MVITTIVNWSTTRKTIHTEGHYYCWPFYFHFFDWSFGLCVCVCWCLWMIYILQISTEMSLILSLFIMLFAIENEIFVYVWLSISKKKWFFSEKKICRKLFFFWQIWKLTKYLTGYVSVNLYLLFFHKKKNKIILFDTTQVCGEIVFFLFWKSIQFLMMILN